MNSSNVPRSFQSTAPTSIFSSGALRSAETIYVKSRNEEENGSSPPAIPEHTSEQIKSNWSAFPKQDSPKLVEPSIATVENAAAAKIFLESHFDGLLSGKLSPRSMRRRNLERQLFNLIIPNDERNQRRQEWYRVESEHLRQTRALKSKTIARKSMKGVHITGYEIVRVLGKGSFGVVRLVRERGETNSDLQRVETLDGHVGRAMPNDALVKDGTRNCKQVYAMKVIRKSDMLRNSQEGHLRAERDFLVASENSRWVVPLIASFQDNNNLYLVMEYMVGGDFLGLLLREDVLDEGIAQWYIAEMILCVEEAHRMNWIHRDVKPDNFLITASGHLKISDFGLAFDGHWTHNQNYYNEQRYSIMRDLDIEVQGDAQDCEEESEKQKDQRLDDLINGKPAESRKPPGKQESGVSGPILDWLNRTQRRSFAKSVVGTSQYMAPEVIRGEMYDGRCDWWSIGIILYEVRSFHHPLFLLY
jgi:hypothetical protein